MHAEGRIKAITTDLSRRQSTRGDLFTMEIEGKAITQRNSAGASLLTKIRIAARERIVRRWTIGRIGGFNLTCHIPDPAKGTSGYSRSYFWIEGFSPVGLDR